MPDDDREREEEQLPEIDLGPWPEDEEALASFETGSIDVGADGPEQSYHNLDAHQLNPGNWAKHARTHKTIYRVPRRPVPPADEFEPEPPETPDAPPWPDLSFAGPDVWGKFSPVPPSAVDTPDIRAAEPQDDGSSRVLEEIRDLLRELVRKSEPPPGGIYLQGSGPWFQTLPQTLADSSSAEEHGGLTKRTENLRSAVEPQLEVWDDLAFHLSDQQEHMNELLMQILEHLQTQKSRQDDYEAFLQRMRY